MFDKSDSEEVIATCEICGRAVTKCDSIITEKNDDGVCYHYICSKCNKKVIDKEKNLGWIDENIYHPSHYQGTHGLEVIDVIKNFTSDLSGFQAVCTGNIIKYITRWRKKNGLEDLRKAQQYLEWLIKDVEDNGQ